MEAARQTKNAILGESFRRLAWMRKDPGFEQAKAMPSKSPNERKTRNAAFRVLRERYGFSDYALHSRPSLADGYWIREHLDINTAQKTATRAFKSVERWSFGLGGKPRFARYGEVASVEGKTNGSGIRYRDGFVLWNGAHANLRMEVLWDPRDPVHAHGLAVAQVGNI
jgi:hypothetical protein